MREAVLLPRRVPRQPQPFLVEGGDCGACVLSGLLDRPLPEVYELVDKARQKAMGKPHSLSYYCMRAFLQQNDGDLFVEAILEHPVWFSFPSGWDLTFGNPGHMQSMGWVPYVRMALRAGFYGLALVDMQKAGPLGHGPNHWVMVCGYRERAEEKVGPDGKPWRSLHEEILISNSATSQPAEEWVDVHAFLSRWGGFNLFLVRPLERTEVT